MENILSMLKEEHREAQTMLLKIERAPTKARKQELYDQLKGLLIPHLNGEERGLYARIRTEVLDEIAAELVDDADHENHELKDLLNMMDTYDVDSKEWKELFEDLKEHVQIHIDELEGRIFTEVKEDFSLEELESMGAEFAEARGHSASP